jgi:putative spermidine/putrescine transport system permease protein
MDHRIPEDQGELTAATLERADSSRMPRERLGIRVSAFFYRHPRVRVALLLAVPLTWLAVVYLGSLIALLIQSFYRLDSFTGTVQHKLSLETWRSVFSDFTLQTVLRTAGMAAVVTVTAVVIAFPLAYYIAKIARPRTKTWLYVAVLLPLWASYLVRVYSWRLILSEEGVMHWFIDRLHLTGALDVVLRQHELGGATLLTSTFGQWMVFVYIWLPFMILPIEAALERVPSSLVDASGDLGAKPRTTFRKVTWPLAVPGVVAGSIFTFSLTLGDYIIPTLVGPGRPTIGSAIYEFQGTAGNLPMAAAYAVIPIVIMGVYLTVARRTGAFEAL